MSIDARVETVILHENGGGELRLIDRPEGSCRGQAVLSFESAPEEVTALNGRDVWGGDAFLMLGNIEIARRVGYTGIEFHDAEAFKRAVREVSARGK